MGSHSNSGSGHLRLLVRHLEAENEHQLPETLATLTLDCVFDDVSLQEQFHGHEGASRYYRMWWDAFDTLVTPEHLHLAGDVAVAETTWRGIHTGSFLGIPPSSREIAIPVVIIVHIRDNLMASERLYWDRFRLHEQLGTT